MFWFWVEEKFYESFGKINIRSQRIIRIDLLINLWYKISSYFSQCLRGRNKIIVFKKVYSLCYECIIILNFFQDKICKTKFHSLSEI